MKIIGDEDAYGYDLIKRMEQSSDGYYSLKEGSLYPILYRLEDRGLIESYSQTFEGERKVARKYYRITQEGQKALEEMLDEWKTHVKKTNQVLEQGGSYGLQ